MRRTILLIATVIIIVILVGGYVGLTALNGNQPAASPTPSITPPASQTPQASPTVSPLPALITEEQVRDAGMAYILTNHPETAELMTYLSWTGGRATPEGIIGYETYAYTSTNWTVTVGYPVTFNPTYDIAANYSAGEVTVSWVGTYASGTITETSYDSDTQIWLTEEQLRDAAMNYIQVYHNETAVLMTDLSWVGGDITPEGLVGYVTYVYNSTSWTVRMGHPVIPYAFYDIAANYSAGDVAVVWEGTYVNGTLTETSYSQTNVGLTTQEIMRNKVITYIKTSHNETAPYLGDLAWTGGRENTGLLGSEVYLYNTQHWTVKIQSPVVLNPTYTITANFSAGIMSVTWTGTYQNGTITETSYNSINIPVLTTQEQVREAVMIFIKTNHAQTSQYMQDIMWTGGMMDQGMMVGSSKYNYQSLGWNMTMQYPITLNPIYTITANYYSPLSQITPPRNIIMWNGTWQNGTITETGYSFTP